MIIPLTSNLPVHICVMLNQNIKISLLDGNTYMIRLMKLFYILNVVVKKTVHERNRSTKAREPALHTHARQEAYKDEVGTCEDRGGWIW